MPLSSTPTVHRFTAAGLLLFLSACAAQEPGRVELRFVWNGGAPTQVLYGMGQVEQRLGDERQGVRVVASAGPVPYEPSKALRLELDRVPHGEDLVVVVEFRPTSSTTDRVLYYGESAPFSLSPGAKASVDAAVALRAAPGVGAPPAGDDGGPKAGGVAISGNPAVVQEPTVDLILWTDSGVTAQVSNFADFRADATRQVSLLDLPAYDHGEAPSRRARLLAGWDLDRGLEPPCEKGEDYCPRQVVAVFADEAGYPSAPFVASVVVDRGTPELRTGGVEVLPAVAAASGVVRTTLVFSETLAGAPGLEVEGGALSFLVQPEGPATAYMFKATAEAGDLGQSGAYALTVKGATDLAGNAAGELAVGEVVLDREAPKITGGRISVGSRQCPAEPDLCFVGRPAWDAEESITVELSVDEELREGSPRARVGSLETDECTMEGPERFSCTLSLNDLEAGDASKSVTVRAEDLAGNQSEATIGRLELDVSPPAIVEGSAAVKLTPAHTNVLQVVEAVTAGTLVRVSFTMTERLSEAPSVTAVGPQDDTPESLRFSLESAAGPSYAYVRLLEGTEHDQGEYLLWVEAADLAGNPQPMLPVQLPVSFEVDTEAPDLPAVDEPGRVLYSRIPWGSDGTAGRKAFCLHGEAGAVGPFDTAIAYDRAELDKARELGRRQADTAGAFGAVACVDSAEGRFELFPADLEVVYLAAADRAGNLSRAAAPVRDVALTASVGGKAVGSEAENPNTVELRRWWRRALLPRDAVEVRASEILLGDDGAELRVEARPPWAQRGVPGDAGPTPRRGHAVAYDSARDRVVLFGGVDAKTAGGCNGSGSSLCGWTWEWDGAGWSRRLPTDPEGDGDPSPRLDHAMAYDSARGRVLLFGGHQGTEWGALSDTWEWDGASWARRAPVDPEDDGDPGARSEHAMAYDERRARVVLFGGLASRWHLIKKATYLGDTWEWDGLSWSLAQEGGLEDEESPDERGEHSMAYDRARARVVLFGGTTKWAPEPGHEDCDMTGLALCGVTWEWDGATRIWRLAAEGAGDGGPLPREKHALAYDAARARVVLFGGENGEDDGGCDGEGEERCDGTWEWDGVRWELGPSAQTDPGSAPLRRSDHALVYDPVGARTLLWGGLAGSSSESCDGTGSNYCSGMWEWDGDRWVHHVPMGSGAGNAPSPRGDHAVAFDSARGRVVLFGGRDDSSANGCDGSGGLFCGDTWEWDASTWARRLPADPEQDGDPTPRDGHAMVYDEARGRVLLFGGYDSGSSGGCPGSSSSLCGDTWEWDGESWERRTLADPEGDGNPSPRKEHSLAYDAHRERVVLFGGFDNHSEPGCDGSDRTHCGGTWEWDGTSWRWGGTNDPEGDGSPHPRARHAAVYDATRKRVLLFSGSYNRQPPGCGGGRGTTCIGTWEWDGVSWARRSPLELPEVGYPTPRVDHALTFDSVRDRIVLFGGRYGFGSRCDGGSSDLCGVTWEWDGMGWARRTPGDVEGSGIPARRERHAMVYDSARSQLFLFGGANEDRSSAGCDGGGSRHCGGTWVAPAGRGPAASAAAAVVFRAPLAAGPATPADLRGVSVDVSAGGHAASGLDEISGLRLMVYDRGTFVPAGAADYHRDTPGALTWTSRDTEQLARLPVGERGDISFAVVSPDLPGAGRAAVAIDQMEVRLRYRLPAP